MTAEDQGAELNHGAASDRGAVHGQEHGRHHHEFPIKLPFLEELKRRNLVRVAILYIVVCYVILEPFELFFHLLELPVWSGRGIVLLMVMGLPAVLLFAWIYEVTPEGIKPTAEVNPSRSITQKTGQKLNRGIIGALSLALVYFVADKFWLSKQSALFDHPQSAAKDSRASADISTSDGATKATPVSDRSIAVLPFMDMSEKKDQEYFSDGLSEELIDRLAQSVDLRVIARTSSFQFKGRNEDIRSIAGKLGVANVLEGSVRKSGRTLRITVQLIRAADGAHLWSQTYERNLADIFKVQEEIAGTVAQALKVALGAEGFPATGAPASVEAYNLLLQGNQLLEQADKVDTERAIDLYQQAIRLEPKLAVVWAKLSAAYGYQVASGWIQTNNGIAMAKEAAKRSLEIDPNLSLAHVALGKLYRDFDWDWKGAEAEFERAKKLAPYDTKIAVLHASLLALEYGQFDEVIAAERQVLARNPVDAHSFCFSGLNLLFAGRLEESLAMWRKAVLLNPRFVGANGMLAITLVKSGRNADALAAAQEETDEAWKLTASAIVDSALGRKSESDAMLQTLKSKYADSAAYNIAQVEGYRGNIDAAIAWLDRGYRQRDSSMIFVKVDPLLSSLHGDPRYQAMLVKLKLNNAGV
jgi:adenylate cyclase